MTELRLRSWVESQRVGQRSRCSPPEEQKGGLSFSVTVSDGAVMSRKAAVVWVQSCVYWLCDLQLMSLCPSAKWWDFVFMSDHRFLCLCVCALTVMMNSKCRPTALTAGLPRSTALGWLVCVCVSEYREQLFSSATRGGQGQTRTSYSCGLGACGNRGFNNVGEESVREESLRRGKAKFTKWEEIKHSKRGRKKWAAKTQLT